MIPFNGYEVKHELLFCLPFILEIKKNSKNKHLPKLVNLGSVNKELLRKKTFLYRTYFADLIFSLSRILERRAPKVFGEKSVREVGRDAAVRY